MDAVAGTKILTLRIKEGCILEISAQIMFLLKTGRPAIRKRWVDKNIKCVIMSAVVSVLYICLLPCYFSVFCASATLIEYEYSI